MCITKHPHLKKTKKNKKYVTHFLKQCEKKKTFHSMMIYFVTSIIDSLILTSKPRFINMQIWVEPLGHDDSTLHEAFVTYHDIYHDQIKSCQHHGWGFLLSYCNPQMKIHKINSDIRSGYNQFRWLMEVVFNTVELKLFFLCLCLV